MNVQKTNDSVENKMQEVETNWYVERMIKDTCQLQTKHVDALPVVQCAHGCLS